VIQQEIRNIRNEHPNLGKEKVHHFLVSFCHAQQLRCPSISTIGNLIRDLGGLRTFPQKVSHFGKIKPIQRTKVLRKPKDFMARYPGHCGSFDTIEKHIHGCRRYLLTFTDLFSRFALAWGTTSHASQAAQEFFQLVTFLFPFPLTYVLTDNGSEFKKHFTQELLRLHIAHYHTYPKQPKMNAHCERFNRTVQEEYLDYHVPELMQPTTFNAGMMRYLLWYNTERPHFGLKLHTPVQSVTNYYPEHCKTYLTNTGPRSSTPYLIH
jgi:transposase InsO family protein